MEAKTLDVIKTEAEIGKLMAETMKLNAEAAKLLREQRWYPFIASAAFIGGVVAVARLFVH
jgi:cell division protein FtsB